ncbi:MAG: inositol-3-phosphate synthase [Ardenticatenales bacterium]|nr:inositol-3-phosphate synthase [Ardenticatenales bacterium]
MRRSSPSTLRGRSSVANPIGSNQSESHDAVPGEPAAGHALPDHALRRQPNGKVRVAIVGVGNCASSLVQGVQYYRDADPDAGVPGLMHVDLGGYHVRDIEFSAAFDIDIEKVGRDLSDAIWAGPNNTMKFSDVPNLGVPVHRGMTHDGLGFYLKQKITKAPGQTSPVADILRDTGTDVVINYLPVGSEMATKWYVEQVLEAGCAFVNCIPVFIGREPYWQARFAARGLPIIGDDIKSQVGATIVHRVLTNLFRERGVVLDRTSQLNVGGNMDFYNMLERERLESKKISKTNAVTSQLDQPLAPDNVYIGPSDYVPWLTDRKWAYIRMEGTTFGDVPLNIELKLEVWDSPNSAGVVIDAVRLAKLALDRGVAGTLVGPAAYLMKSPPAQYTDEQARAMTEAFIANGAPPSVDGQPAPVSLVGAPDAPVQGHGTRAVSRRRPARD